MSLVPYVHVASPLTEAAVGTVVALSEQEHRHLTRVLRLREGAVVQVADGMGSSAGGRLMHEAVEVTSDPVSEPVATPEFWVAQALPKGRKLDEVIQQVTELGVDGIAPIVAERTIARPAETKQPRLLERWEGIARSASEQSRRPRRPHVCAPRPFEALLRDAQDGDRKVAMFLADPSGTPLPRALAELTDQSQIDRLMLIVGPEGGFTPAELAAFDAAGGSRVGLGPTVLRTEHAAAAGSAVIQAGLGRW